MPAQFQALLFDMDGVVIDTHASIEHYWNRLAQSHNINLSVEDFDLHIHGTQARATLDRYFAQLSEADKDVISEDILIYEDRLSYVLMPGVHAFLESLKDYGVPTALVTSGTQRKVDAVFSQLPLRDKFNELITADLVLRGKPDPECYALAAQSLALPPESCIVFEDSRSGTQAALSAGAQVIGIGKTDMLLEIGAMQVIPHFEGLSLHTGDEGVQLIVGNSQRYAITLNH